MSEEIFDVDESGLGEDIPSLEEVARSFLGNDLFESSLQDWQRACDSLILPGDFRDTSVCAWTILKLGEEDEVRRILESKERFGFLRLGLFLDFLEEETFPLFSHVELSSLCSEYIDLLSSCEQFLLNTGTVLGNQRYGLAWNTFANLYPTRSVIFRDHDRQGKWAVELGEIVSGVNPRDESRVASLRSSVFAIKKATLELCITSLKNDSIENIRDQIVNGFLQNLPASDLRFLKCLDERSTLGKIGPSFIRTIGGREDCFVTLMNLGGISDTIYFAQLVERELETRLLQSTRELLDEFLPSDIVERESRIQPLQLDGRPLSVFDCLKSANIRKTLDRAVDNFLALNRKDSAMYELQVEEWESAFSWFLTTSQNGGTPSSEKPIEKSKPRKRGRPRKQKDVKELLDNLHKQGVSDKILSAASGIQPETLKRDRRRRRKNLRPPDTNRTNSVAE